MKGTPLVWTVTLGAVGFSCGFFGPLIFSPEANQGPLLGILIAGPIGAALGLAMGSVVHFVPPLALPNLLELEMLGSVPTDTESSRSNSWRSTAREIHGGDGVSDRCISATTKCHRKKLLTPKESNQEWINRFVAGKVLSA